MALLVCTSRSHLPPKLRPWCLLISPKASLTREHKETPTVRKRVNLQPEILRDLSVRRGRLILTYSEKNLQISKSRSQSSESKRDRKRTKIHLASRTTITKRTKWRNWRSSRNKNNLRMPIRKVKRGLRKRRPIKLTNASKTRQRLSTTLATSESLRKSRVWNRSEKACASKSSSTTNLTHSNLITRLSIFTRMCIGKTKRLTHMTRRSWAQTSTLDSTAQKTWTTNLLWLWPKMPANSKTEWVWETIRRNIGLWVLPNNSISNVWKIGLPSS